MRITGLIFVVSLTACSSKFEAFKPAKGVVPLQKSGCANFSEEWCGPNLNRAAGDSSICKGTVMVEGDMIFSAIKIKRGSSEACISALRQWREINKPGCGRAIVREYYDLNDAASDVTECLNDQGEVISLDGSGAGVSFRVVRP